MKFLLDYGFTEDEIVAFSANIPPLLLEHILNSYKLVSKNIPKDILKRMVRAGISKPFQCVETCPYEPLDVELVKAVRRHNRNGEEMMDAGAKPKMAGALHAAWAKPVGGA